MQILVGCLLLSRQVSSFDFGDIFEQAFGGGGGNFQFQFGGHGGGHGGRQQQRQTSFPSHVKNTITDEFAWLRGTEWNWNGNPVRFTVDGTFTSSARECSQPKQCIWAAYQDRIYVMMSQSGLYVVRPSGTPESSSAEHLGKVSIAGKRDADGSAVKLVFSRIFDMTSREDSMDLYAVLGVSLDASTADIKKAYRRLTIEYHPDQNQGNPSAQARFNEITRANEILSDPTKRMLYDTGGMEAIRGMDKGEIQKGQDVMVEVGVPLSQFFTGGTVKPNYKRRIVCTSCRVNPKLERCRGCSRCPAEIRMVNQQVGPGFYVQQQVQVESKELCKMEEKPMEIAIEKGAMDGDQVVVEHMAEQRPGMIPGHVVVRLKQLNDAKFRRDGNNLHTRITVTLQEALLGFRASITQLDGSVLSVTRTGVTQPMAVVQMAGAGMPSKGDSERRGDLFVTVTVEFPNTLTAAQRDLVSGLFPAGPKESVIKAEEL